MLAMVIDDSRAMRRILGKIMSDLGYTVAEAGDGAEALAKLEQCLADGELPEIALIDWNMPTMDGLSFVSAVRADRRYRSITLMMVTTESEHGQIVKALAAGAHEYVIKPFTPDAIVEKLQLLGLVRDGVPA
jgi:two-component system chemotaxis response regulator CheY